MFLVYLNDHIVGHCESNKAACKRWISYHLRSTHMGEWRKLQDGYEYATTIGQYFQFKQSTKRGIT